MIPHHARIYLSILFGIFRDKASRSCLLPARIIFFSEKMAQFLRGSDQMQMRPPDGELQSITMHGGFSAESCLKKRSDPDKIEIDGMRQGDVMLERNEEMYLDRIKRVHLDV